MRAVILALVLLFLVDDASARSTAVRAAFQRHHPCPSTHRKVGTCPGYVVDHVVPLCAGGADAPSNMQWQTKIDSYRKDAQERRLCRARR